MTVCRGSERMQVPGYTTFKDALLLTHPHTRVFHQLSNIKKKDVMLLPLCLANFLWITKEKCPTRIKTLISYYIFYLIKTQNLV